MFIVLLLINSAFEGDFRNKFLLAPKLPLILFCGLYLFYIIGMFFTQNLPSGWFDLQVKLSLLAFPLILLTSDLSKKQISVIFLSFVAGNLLSACVCLLTALYDYIVNANPHFFYGGFSLFLHPAYYSMYLDFCIALLLITFYKTTIDLPLSTLTRLTFIFFFSAIVILLSSKAGLLILVLIYIVAVIAYVLLTRRYARGFALLLITTVGIYAIVTFIPEISGRFKSAFHLFESETLDKTSPESNSIRVFVWKEDLKLIQQNLLIGVGTGDVKDELLVNYKAEGITGAYSPDPITGKPTRILNAHSQFFQTFIALGLPGFLLFVAGFILPLVILVQRKNILYMSFIAIIVLNFLVESMLETQAGVIFYAFFNSLLYLFMSKT